MNLEMSDRQKTIATSAPRDSPIHDRIDEYQEANSMSSTSEALRALIQAGLEAEKKDEQLDTDGGSWLRSIAIAAAVTGFLAAALGLATIFALLASAPPMLTIGLLAAAAGLAPVATAGLIGVWLVREGGWRAAVGLSGGDPDV